MGVKGLNDQIAISNQYLMQVIPLIEFFFRNSVQISVNYQVLEEFQLQAYTFSSFHTISGCGRTLSYCGCRPNNDNSSIPLPPETCYPISVSLSFRFETQGG